MFCAPQWHASTQTPRPRKSAWHCDITNVISPHGPPRTRNQTYIFYDTTNHPAQTRHVYTSMFRAPQRHVAAQTRRVAGARDERWYDVICLLLVSADLVGELRPQYHAMFASSAPACFALPSGTAPRKRTFHQASSPASSRQNERFVQDFLEKSRVQSPRLQNERDFLQKSRFGSARQAFRTRLPPKVTSILQNERLVRDFLQKSRVKSPKRAFRTRLPQKLACQSLQNERFARDFLQKGPTMKFLVKRRKGVSPLSSKEFLSFNLQVSGAVPGAEPLLKLSDGMVEKCRSSGQIVSCRLASEIMSPGKRSEAKPMT